MEQIRLVFHMLGELLGGKLQICVLEWWRWWWWRWWWLYYYYYHYYCHSFILRCLERGTKPILPVTSHDGRRHFHLSGIRTCVQQHGSPTLYHCATYIKYPYQYLGHPWHSGSMLDCWSTGWAINPASGIWFITKCSEIIKPSNLFC